MIVAMQEKATEEQIDAVIDALVESGVEVHRTTGEMQTILAAVGQTATLDLSKFEIMPGVMHVHRISSPYKLAGRSFRPEGTVIEFRNGITVGGKNVVAMGGPCSVETREQMFETARRVKGAGGTFLRGGAFKPRSSPYAFQGMDISAIPMVKKLSHLPIIGDPSHGTGRRDMVAPLARAAVAAGADGIIVEVHPNADKAASDAAQTLYPDQFDKLMSELRLIATAVGRSM